MKSEYLAPGVLVAGCLALFIWYHAPAFSFYFSQDDFPLLVSSRPGWVPVWKFFTMGSEREYRPITQHFFFYMNQLLFDLNVNGHHAMNLLVHFFSTLLVAGLAWQWLGRWAALPSAFLFAFHPSHFYEVFWVSGISQGGYVLFLLVSIFAFSAYHRHKRVLYQMISILAVCAAFLSKEDAVMIPVILTCVALFESGQEGMIRKRVLSTLPYWVLLPVYLWVRMGLLGFGLPQKGAYHFGFDMGVAEAKLIQYGTWLFVNNWFLGFALVIGIYCLSIGIWRAWTRKELSNLNLPLLLPFLAAASIFPTLLVPATGEYYLSFSTAALGLLLSGLLMFLKNLRLRNSLAIVLTAVFLFFSVARQENNLTDRNLALRTPIPFKANWCKTWVNQLRRQQPASDAECVYVFRDIPLQEWEKAWFVYLPMVAWDRWLPNVVAHIAGTPEPHLNGSCVAVWSLASGNIRRIR